MTYLPGLDMVCVVWFPNTGSPLVSRLSGLVVDSVASVVFRVSVESSIIIRFIRIAYLTDIQK